MGKKNFDVEKTTDQSPVFLISIDGSFIDYEFTLDDLKALESRLTQAIKDE